MEQHFQDVAPKAIHDKNLESFSAQFYKRLTQKLIPQQWRDIMHFKIISTINPIFQWKTGVNYPLHPAWNKG